MNTTTSPCAPVTSPSTENHHHSSNFDSLPGKPKRTSNPKQGTHKHVPKLKISVINFCGIRSKIASLQAFLENNKPDIIIGTETHLSPDISNCELFPASYKIIRKDRNPHGGGVLIATKSSNMDSDCEIIWLELHGLQGTQSDFIVSFYHPPGSDISILQQLNKSLGKLVQQAKNHTVVLAGDFNLLGINWGLSSTRTDARDHKQCQYLLDIINDYHLTQLVDEPTRTIETTASILDLILTSKPALVEDIKISPGISDHDIITASLLHQAQKNKCKPRKVLDYKYGDSEKFLKDLSRDCENFLNSHPDTNPVEANWTSFKVTL